MSSDISDLLVSQPLPRCAVHADARLMKAADQGAPHGAAYSAMVITAVAGSVAAAVLAVSMLVWRMRRRRQESDEVVIVQDTPGLPEVSVS